MAVYDEYIQRLMNFDALNDIVLENGKAIKALKEQRVEEGGIIDVTSLPTENINTKAIYRVKEVAVEHYLLANGVKNTLVELPVTVYTVDVLPEVGEPFANMSALTKVTVYVQTSTSEVYFYKDEELASASEASVGWYSFTEVAEYVIVNSPEEATDSSIAYFVREESGYKHHLYTYTESGWHEIIFAYKELPKFDITWDGVIGDRFALDVSSLGMPDTYFVKMSDEVFTNDEVLGATLINVNGYSRIIDSDVIDSSRFSGALIIDEVVVVYSADDLNAAIGTPAGYVTNGTYFLYASDGTDTLYVTRFVAPTKITKIDGQYLDLSDLHPVATSGNYNDLTNKPTLFSGNYNDLTNKPTLFSGNYNDLTNKPTLPTKLADLSEDATHRTVNDTEKASWNAKSDFDGHYDSLNGRPFYADGLYLSIDDAIEGQDGTWENNENHSLYTYGTVHCVSNETYSEAQLIGASFVRCADVPSYGETSSEGVLTNEHIVSSSSEYLHIWVNDAHIFVAYEDNCVIDFSYATVTLPIRGTYFARAYIQDVTKWFKSLTKSGGLKKLDNKFLDLLNNEDFKSLPTVDKITATNFASGSNADVEVSEEGIYWTNDEIEIELGGDGAVYYHNGSTFRIPLVAGDGVTFELDEENQVVRVNATGGSGSKLYRHKVKFDNLIPDTDRMFILTATYYCRASECIAADFTDSCPYTVMLNNCAFTGYILDTDDSVYPVIDMYANGNYLTVVTNEGGMLNETQIDVQSLYGAEDDYTITEV